jgi:hypothetical protein
MNPWLNYPTDRPPEVSQLWHRDPGDLQLVKAFVYLVDVNERCGPFTYIPRTHPFGAETAKARHLETKKRPPNNRMSRVFPPESWRVRTGSANTMILADARLPQRRKTNRGQTDSGDVHVYIWSAQH